MKIYIVQLNAVYGFGQWVVVAETEGMAMQMVINSDAHAKWEGVDCVATLPTGRKRTCIIAGGSYNE